MRVAVATHAPHGSKHGTAFAEQFAAADGATIVVVGSVVGGREPLPVADLLRVAATALVTSSESLPAAVAALDRIVVQHARDHREDELAAIVALLALAPDGARLGFAGAGQLHCALVAATDAERTHLHGIESALGTGFSQHPHPVKLQEYPMHRGDVVVAATFPVVPPPPAAGTDVAEQLVRHAGAVDAAVAVVMVD
jgi:hypothetical protein